MDHDREVFRILYFEDNRKKNTFIIKKITRKSSINQFKFDIGNISNVNR